MINKIILIMLTLFANIAFCAPIKIVTSITPIASILSMITEDAAEIVVVDTSVGCPHHYHMKPSDKDKITDAQMLFYVDDKFDAFAGRLFASSEGKTVKISDMKSINFIDDSGKENWHFWLSLKNIAALHEELSNVLLKEFPELKKYIAVNRHRMKTRIDDLVRYRQRALHSIGELVVLSDSLEHFFDGVDAKVTKLYQKSSSSLKDLENLEYILNSSELQCIVIDSAQNPEIYKRFNKKIIQLDSENWSLKKSRFDNQDMFFDKYKQMLYQLHNCR